MARARVVSLKAVRLTVGRAPCQRSPVPVREREDARRRFEEFARNHQAALEAFAGKLCGHPADARDLVQDTFERALRGFDSLADGTHERAWLFTILHHLFIDRCRRRTREPAMQTLDPEAPELAQPDPEPEPQSAPAWTQLSLQDVRAALAELDEGFRTVYQLHAIEGHGYSVIAERLGIPVNTVGTRLARARKKLRAILARRAGEPR
jgi:RNA polymerase sigma-70 factor (ECF subfamily)